ncbi:putative cytosol alanyl aminopeptidase [Helianthus annuus]|uniref:Cytosol alanyl aminopeptidase n=1 Tax=Helianthus annuus TaxID=4232 RepID=A0A9K3E1D5_HELAN|nr:putative cytosol alanyl aminopeptidase [Helianthus annuus]KAJ0451819.1 putative cytosol alanyl aminopeptidase [Helianthus annuus]KAJ0456512.1 putative cytosol alanyl aminopeptidase [Helianthus annuus]KAJ0473706.1 putative cytosol alanyl aminopeptidase [Helianthus annuus]KAJ0649283.1 putative cytosol alanyl aminopeptidase [Helianthus annuus]
MKMLLVYTLQNGIIVSFMIVHILWRNILVVLRLISHCTPVLLSNGNLIEQGDLEFLYLSKHYRVGSILCFGRTRSRNNAIYLFKKQCYLFALVAGQLASRDNMFTTCLGRKVALRIWTPAEDLPKTEHAMYSLKAAMK